MSCRPRLLAWGSHHLREGMSFQRPYDPHYLGYLLSLSEMALCNDLLRILPWLPFINRSPYAIELHIKGMSFIKFYGRFFLLFILNTTQKEYFICMFVFILFKGAFLFLMVSKIHSISVLGREKGVCGRSRPQKAAFYLHVVFFLMFLLVSKIHSISVLVRERKVFMEGYDCILSPLFLSHAFMEMPSPHFWSSPQCHHS